MARPIVHNQHKLINYTHCQSFRNVRSRASHGEACMKNSNNNVPSGKTDYFKGLAFHIGKDIYERTIDRLALYTSMQFKNGSDVMVCLHSEEYIETEVPVMPENLTDNYKLVWEYNMGD